MARATNGTLLVITATTAILSMLAGCSTTATPATAKTITATASSTTASSATPSSPPSTGTPTAANTTSPPGCSAKGSGIPAGAHTRTTIDVDGDGKPDTEWFSKDGETFGITTTSGASSTVHTQFSSGAGPGAMTAKLPGKSTIINNIGDNRLISVYRYEHCGLQPVKDTRGAQYKFDLTGAHGYGVGCEDLTGTGKDTLVGYQLNKPYGSLQNHQQVTITTAAVNLAGTTATAGKIGTATTELPGGKSTLAHVTTVSCGSTTITNDGLHL